MSALLQQQVAATRAAAPVVAPLDADTRNALLLAMADAINNQQAMLLAANARDLQAATERGLSAAMIDRLALNPARLAALATSLREVAALPDPLGSRRPFSQPASGISVFKQRIPLGVILMIYEARPNVAVDAAALCLKSGNAVLLRGGSEARHSNAAIGILWQQVLAAQQLPAAAVTVLTECSHDDVNAMLQWDELIDLVIPRGGEKLIRSVAAHSRIPVIRHYKGVCHLFVDASANPSMAIDLLIDGKCSRPAVCNALETLLVHASIAASWLPQAAAALRSRQVELRGCPRTCALLADCTLASDSDWSSEYLDKIISIKIVDDLDAAIRHIRQYGSQHSEVICTSEPANAEKFLHQVDASVVLVNASSRFNDGGELGLGAEIGIATTKLHAYGPMGLEALTAEKYVVLGHGEVRHPESRQR
ncbi:glutamate-5-semialdehyde dehydrogenase [Permianibacter sp. IMCC34836]|uniref:glutamate-5-semialdehyde dehydrogenase n=1 Tax=Permianibacter fluminis TaxID=2738515 RepID=UPI002E2DE66F|nr:glutamate-5-semialdehyde dehydrogenase [Permianibacter fluminis]NQD38155.1 glutamate-5-semialdehyde dehydrogenase [Permianibacter fluminis]